MTESAQKPDAFSDGLCAIICPSARVRCAANAAKLGIDVVPAPTFVLRNLSTLGSISALVQYCQMSTLTWALHDDMQYVAVAISPVFTSTRQVSLLNSASLWST